MIEKPLFLVGSERSGTTLLRLMLDHHPQLSLLGEFEFAVDRLPAGDGWPDIETYRQWLPRNRVFRHWDLSIDPQLDYPQLVDSFLVQKRTRDNKPLVGATVHRRFDCLRRIWPDARFVHLCRDGRDVARSVMVMGWAGHVYRAADWWHEAETLWQQTVDRLGPDDWIDVTYEQLVRDAQATLDRICRFIGVDYDPAMLDYADDSTYDQPDPSLISQWKRKLSERDVQLIEARLGDLLTARGYELSDLSPLKVGPLRRWWLNLRSRWGRARFGIRRYGMRLFLKHHLSRRVGPNDWRQRVQLAIDEVDTRHLK